ncbi:hypothetical protein AAFF_G00074870 [Aldrovandia affinis]|uniref:Uncharacterized protein n=1 Tax=Aldrovandia affinis TaxID=143900 RepID=A0AAD7WE47_9TELE|nr:hypothetical protein AAFF_G00074870 [Aldrovandia affinis]
MLGANTADLGFVLAGQGVPPMRSTGCLVTRRASLPSSTHLRVSINPLCIRTYRSPDRYILVQLTGFAVETSNTLPDSWLRDERNMCETGGGREGEQPHTERHRRSTTLPHSDPSHGGTPPLFSSLPRGVPYVTFRSRRRCSQSSSVAVRENGARPLARPLARPRKVSRQGRSLPLSVHCPGGGRTKERVVYPVTWEQVHLVTSVAFSLGFAPRRPSSHAGGLSGEQPGG